MKSYPVRAPDLVVLLAYDNLCTFEYAIAVEVFALRRPGLGVPWYRTKVAAVGSRSASA
ncbi:MAG: hypothetical protein ABL900_02305 [Burkholderiaceae bacterium]